MNQGKILETINKLHKDYVLKSSNPAWLKQKPEFFEYNPRIALQEIMQLKTAVISNTKNHFEKIIDVGSGKGILCVAFSDASKEIIGLEPDQDARNIAELTKEYFNKNNIKFIDGTAQNMPFPDNHFDLAISTSALEHISNTSSAIKETFRVLKPNGYFYINTPNYLWFKEPHYMLPMLPLMPKIFLKILARFTNRNPKYIDHIQYLTPQFLNKTLKKEGFSVKNISLQNLHDTLFNNRRPKNNGNKVKNIILRFLKLTKINHLFYLFFKLTQFYPHILIIAKKMNNNLTEKKFWSDIQNNIKLPTTVDLKRTPAFIKIDKILKKYLPQNNNLKLLEIGCSPGRWLIYFNNQFNYQVTGIEYTKIGADLSKENLKIFGANGTVFNEDIFKASLAPENFDVVFSYGFLEHFQDSENIIKTHWNLIQKGGYMIIIVPNFKQSLYYFLQKLIDIDNVKKHKLISAGDLKTYFNNSNLSGKILFSGYTGIYYPWVVNINKLRGIKYKTFDFFARYSQAVIRRLKIKKETKFFSPYALLIVKKY